MRQAVILGAALTLAGCSAGEAPPSASSNAPLVVGGCDCPSGGTCAELSYSDIPPDGQYVITTFGGGSDTQPTSCGTIADGTWAYVAGRARWGCGAKLLIEANGKQCVAEVTDCGPNRCVEEAASNSSCASHFPIIDASPIISQHLIGQSSAGWSEHILVQAVEVDPSTPIGCPGGPVVGTGGTGGTGGAGGSAAGGTGGTATGGAGAMAGGAGSPSTGGTGGGAVGACTAPNCGDCGGCEATCLCDTGDPVLCGEVCGGGSAGASAGGSPGFGGLPGGAGVPGFGGTPSGTPSSCSADGSCLGCTGCYDECRCQGGEVDSCLTFCSNRGAGEGGSAGSVTTAGGPAVERGFPASESSASGCSMGPSRPATPMTAAVFGLLGLAVAWRRRR